jgi:hypothetical protein
VPCADAAQERGTVYLRHDLKADEDGNTYRIDYIAMTNTNSDVLDSPIVQAANADLATNRWPIKRMHMDLSIDGGQTWIRRIGYGVAPGGPFGELVWSPPEDYSLLTTNAMLRLTTLDGDSFGHRGDGTPYDVAEGAYITSPPFKIVGATITAPEEGAILYSGFPVDLTWSQAGCGGTMTLMWISEETYANASNQVIATFTNCVDGINTRSITINVAQHVDAKFVLQSSSDPAIIGYSGIINFEP